MNRIATLALVVFLGACERQPAAAAAAPDKGPAPASPVVAPKPAGETAYYFGTSDESTLIQFESRAPVGTLVGTTRKIGGTATINVEAGSGQTHLTVPVNSLSTGMAGPDNALKGATWLDMKKYPTIEFKSEKATLEKPHTWHLQGKFTMKGVTRDLPAAVEVRQLPADLARKLNLGAGDWIRARTEFKVKLSDYGIKVPEGTDLTVEDEWKVKVQLYGTTAKPASTGVSTAGPEEDIARPIRPKAVTLDPAVPGKRYKFGVFPQLTNITAESVREAEAQVVRGVTAGGHLAIELEKGSGQLVVTVPVKSLKTGVEKRDQDLHGPEGLDVAQFPHLDLENARLSKKDDKSWNLQGNLTLHGVTRPLALVVAVERLSADLMQKAKRGEGEGIRLTGGFKIKLSEFGVKPGRLPDEWDVKFDLIAVVPPQ